MKTLTVIFAAFILLFTFNTFADQRIDADTNNCHIAIDPNDDDNEIDLPGCSINPQINRYTDEAGDRIGVGSYFGKYLVELGHDVLPKGMAPDRSANIYLRGTDANQDKYARHIEAAGTPCVVVRTNYQANNNGDDQNQTEYVTNDWDLSVEFAKMRKAKQARYEDDGKEKDEDDEDDRSERKSAKAMVAVWNVRLHCRNGAEQ